MKFGLQRDIANESRESLFFTAERSLSLQKYDKGAE